MKHENHMKFKEERRQSYMICTQLELDQGRGSPLSEKDVAPATEE